jgi:N-acetyl-D-muramate 6-phosphate phosphatase
LSTQTILFDLDGTLVDTAPDLGLALNIQRERHGMPALPQALIRPHASHGSKGLLGVGFGLVPEDADFASMREEYLDLYDQVLTHAPVMFDGVAGLLSVIEAAGMRWGVVTNKPRRFTLPLMDAMGLAERAACIVSGDDASRPKPYPDSLLLACDLAGTPALNCIYVGDAERDIQAGKAAGMRTVVACYGYLAEHDTPESWGAEMLIDAPGELAGLLGLEPLQLQR